MKEILDFLRKIRENNNREWFNTNKDLYLNAKQKFEKLAQEILDGVKQFDTSCKELSLQDCIYRFYRDIRFSKDKSPYKTHFGVYICPKGKKSLWAGYYLHIDTGERQENMPTAIQPSSHLLACGSYMPDNTMLQSIREDIFNNGENYIKTIKTAKNFSLCKEPALKKLPKNIPSSKYDDYMRLKTQLLEQYIDEDFLMQQNLAKRITQEFKSCYDFVSFINNSISYSGNF